MRTFFCILFLMAGAGACSPSFQADLQEVEITQRGVKVVGAPATGPDSTMSTSQSFTLSSKRMGWAKKINSEVRLHQVTIAANGLSDLSFLELARVTASAPSTQDVVEIMSYVRDPQAPSSATIEASAPEPVDITRLWQADQTVIELQVAGHLPAQDWTLDLTLSLSGKITYSM